MQTYQFALCQYTRPVLNKQMWQILHGKGKHRQPEQKREKKAQQAPAWGFGERRKENEKRREKERWKQTQAMQRMQEMLTEI